MSTLKLFKNIQCSRQSWVIKAGARMGLPDESGGGGLEQWGGILVVLVAVVLAGRRSFLSSRK